MDNGGIWPGDESYFQNIRETALQDTIEQLTKELAEARAEIERLKGVVISQITPEPVALSSYSTTAEPAKDKRDKLIEQLKKALESAKQQHYVNDDDNWYSCPASGLCSNDNAGTDCNCGADYVNSIIQAALRAADGGE